MEPNETYSMKSQKECEIETEQATGQPWKLRKRKGRDREPISHRRRRAKKGEIKRCMPDVFCATMSLSK